MPVYTIPRIKSHHSETSTTFIPDAFFRQQPYESGPASPPPADVSADRIAPSGTVSPDAPNQFGDALSSFPWKNLRTDARFVSARTGANGWEFTWLVRGSRQLQQAYRSGRGIAMWLAEYCDTQLGNLDQPNDWPTNTNLFSDDQVIAAFIKTSGGRASQLGPRGLNGLTVNAATPDFFLSKTQIPKLPYLRYALAAEERATMPSLPRDEAHLGFEPLGTGPMGGDPVAGFAHFLDQDASGVTMADLLAEYPCNERHLSGGDNPSWGLPDAGSSVLSCMYEVLAHHAEVDRGNGYVPLPTAFKCHIDFAGDIEDKVPEISFGPGTVNDAIITASGDLAGLPYRYWWDSLSEMWLVRDYSNFHYSSLSPVFVFEEGPSLLGQFDIYLGSSRQRIQRVAVRGLWSSGADGMPPILDHFVNGKGVGSYPPNVALGREGSAEVIEGYHGYNSGTAAKSQFSRKNRETTVQISGFPFPTIAFALYNHLVSLKIKDPLGAFDWTEGATSEIGLDVGQLFPGGTYGQYGKLFSVEGVSIELADADATGGGRWNCTLSLSEVIPLMNGA